MKIKVYERHCFPANSYHQGLATQWRLAHICHSNREVDRFIAIKNKSRNKKFWQYKTETE